MLSPRELVSLAGWQHWLHDDPVRIVLAVITVLVWCTAVRLVIALVLAIAAGTLSMHGSAGSVRRRLTTIATHAAPRWARPLVVATIAAPVLAGPALGANAAGLHAKLPSLDRPGAPLTQLAPAATHSLPDIGEPTTVAPTPPPVIQPVPVTGREHVVVPGESLWSISAAELGPQASPAAIAHRWPQWWHANQGTIGSDPRLILPGQHLHVPAQDKDDSR